MVWNVPTLAFHWTVVSSSCLKLVSATFYQIFISHQMIALQKPLKNVFYFILKALLFSRHSVFCISVYSFFLSVSHCFRGWWKINLKDCDDINVLNKNLITHFIWYLEKEKSYDVENLSIDRVLNKKHFYRKAMQKMCTTG